MQRAIKVRWFFTHPPQRVWAYLTEADKLSQWLMKNDFKPVKGHRFSFHTKPLPKMKFDGIVYCEVLEVMPFSRLSYTWRGGPEPGVITLDTVLTFTLTEKDGGTELLLERTGFRGFGNYIASIFMRSGWKGKILKRLQMLLNN